MKSKIEIELFEEHQTVNFYTIRFQDEATEVDNHITSHQNKNKKRTNKYLSKEIIWKPDISTEYRSMIKNKRLEERRKSVSKDVDIFVRQSFDIVDRIHEILAKQGKEQKDLARLLGKSESEISKWMSGTHNFTINTLAKIQAVLGESIIHVTKETQLDKPITC